MTVIAAISNGTRTCIGSDTIAVNNGTVMHNGPKWIVAEDLAWAVGHAGCKRTFTLLSQAGSTLFAGCSNEQHMVDRLREIMLGDNYNTDSYKGPKCFGEQFIIASPSRVWSVSTCLGLLTIPNGELWADGSGRAYALGAGNFGGHHDHMARLHAALEAAIRYDDGCGEPTWTRGLS